LQSFLVIPTRASCVPILFQGVLVANHSHSSRNVTIPCSGLNRSYLLVTRTDYRLPVLRVHPVRGSTSPGLRTERFLSFWRVPVCHCSWRRSDRAV